MNLRLLVLLVVVVVCGVSVPAAAQDFSGCQTVQGGYCPTQSAAQAAAMAEAQAAVAAAKQSCAQYGWVPSCEQYSVGPVEVFRDEETGWGMVRIYSHTPSGGFLQAHTRMFPLDAEEEDCSDREPLGPNHAATNGEVCKDGCSFVPAGVSVCINGECFGASWVPTGGQCSAGEAPEFDEEPYDPNKPVCTATGGDVHCVKPNGDHCVSSAGGSSLCWAPGETGPRMTADGTTGAAREVAPAQPQPPPNMENPTAGTSQAVTVNNTTYNSTTYTGTGNTGGQPNVGNGGRDNGVGGSGNGSGNGEGDGNGDGDGNGPGGVAGDGGPLYEGDGEKTVEGVIDEFVEGVSDIPIIDAARSFFDLSVPGGSCPVWTSPANEWMPALVFDFFCRGELQIFLQVVGVLLMIICAFYAFHLFVGN